jgi:Tol biopolymer transport system component
MRIRHIVRRLVLSGLAVLCLPVSTASGWSNHQPLVAGPASSTRSSARHAGLIVFGANATGSSQLYTIRPDGSHLRQITHLKTGDAGSPDFSPDGRRIVFDVAVPNADNTDSVKIAMIDADGSHLRWLPIRGKFPGQPSFTADGRGIVFERFDGVSDDALFTAHLDGTHERRLTRPPKNQGDTEPNVSPDGKMISFVRLGPGDTDAALFTLNLRTGKQRRLTPSSFDVAIKTGWSPNGRRILFSRDAYHLKPGVSGNVMSISRKGHRVRAVTHYRGGDVNGYAGSYSPDARHVVYRREATDKYSLIIARSDGTHAKSILTSSTLRPRFMDWGPTSCGS